MASRLDERGTLWIIATAAAVASLVGGVLQAPAKKTPERCNTGHSSAEAPTKEDGRERETRQEPQAQ